jgi:hypothetical protein
MPALASPVADERSALREFVSYHQAAYFAIAYGLTDEQARATPSASAMSIGGVIKHVTGMQRTWMERVAAAPNEPEPDNRPFEERRAEFEDEFVMREDQTLRQVLDAFAAQNAQTLQLVDRVGPARRAGRRDPRIHRRRNDVRAHRRPGRVARNRLAQTLEGRHVVRRAYGF